MAEDEREERFCFRLDVSGLFFGIVMPDDVVR